MDLGVSPGKTANMIFCYFLLIEIVAGADRLG